MCEWEEQQRQQGPRHGGGLLDGAIVVGPSNEYETEFLARAKTCRRRADRRVLKRNRQRESKGTRFNHSSVAAETMAEQEEERSIQLGFSCGGLSQTGCLRWLGELYRRILSLGPRGICNERVAFSRRECVPFETSLNETSSISKLRDRSMILS